MKPGNALLLACGVLLAGCSDSTGPAAASSVSFSYSGSAVGSGTYSVNGMMPPNLNDTFGTTAWAVGFYELSSASIYVSAAAPKTSATWDVSALQVQGTGTGSRGVDAGCDINGVSCDGVVMFVGLQGTSDADFASHFTYSCLLTTGTIDVTTATETRIAGTFSGTGSCSTPAGVQSTFTVTNGTFNVPVSQGQ